MNNRMQRCILLAVLTVLVFIGAAQAEEASYLGKFTADTSASALDMGDVQVGNMDAFVKFLSQFENLEKVDMYATKIGGKDMDRLAADFPDVEFGWTMRIGDHLVRTDATAFSTLHNNQSKTHNQNQFKYLKYCKNLQALDIGHNSVTDLSFLYDLPDLKVLIVACNINLHDITPIGSLTKLEYLEIFKNDIHDLSPLANCKNLIDLNICFNRIKDWTPIHGLEKLERLWVYNSNNYSDKQPVPADVVKALKDALPECYIDSKSYSTLGGWRDHNRYYVIYHMFKYGEYIPFEQADEIRALYPEPLNM